MTDKSDARREQMERLARIRDIDRRLLRLLSDRIEACRQSSSATVDLFGKDWADAAILAEARKLEMDEQAVAAWIRHTASVCDQAASASEPVAYLGPIYSYSYLAAVKYFGLAAELVPVTTISAAFEEVIRGQATFAVVPIENSTDGRVIDTLGMFARSPAEICGEVLLPIHHCLLGTVRRAEIAEVQSKPQALSQCRRWLEEHLPNARLVEISSTAMAAAHAAQQPGVAAIASREAGIHHALQVIDENIEDNPNNVTRFAVIGNRRHEPSGHDKTSLMFQLAHRPGALATAMVIFKESNVNLTWIESFPLPNRPSEYLFFVELDGHRDNDEVHQAVELLERETLRLDVLGSYPRGLAETASASQSH